MHETNSQFREKYDIKSFQRATVLTSALHAIMFIKVSKTMYLFICGNTRIRIRRNSWYAAICMRLSTLNSYSVTVFVTSAASG